MLLVLYSRKNYLFVQLDRQHIVNRFLSYVAYDTTSSETVPVTEGQLMLSKYLAKELKEIGCSNVICDNYGYTYAFIPSNQLSRESSIGFIAHIDTSPDAPAANVKTHISQGTGFYEGQDVIFTDQTTLLGADDKAGVTAIVSAAEFLLSNPSILHPDLYLAFTPNEEVGRGTEHFNRSVFKADFAYTIDGGRLGELEYENFNAAQAIVTISGVNVHPGYAKGKMVNAILLASDFISQLPASETPNTTDGYEGFYHVTHISGSVENAEIKLILRDFSRTNLNKRIDFLKSTADTLNAKYKDQTPISVSTSFQYGNMKDALVGHENVIERARKAMLNLDISPIEQPIRGGTDGAMLTLEGLPCPNIFAGGENFHSRYEFLPIPSLLKATQVVIEIAKESN